MSVRLPSVNSRTPASGRPRNRCARAESDGRQRRARPVESQGVEPIDGPEVRVEDVAADVEVLLQPGLPRVFLGEPVAQPVAARRRVLAVADQHALAVVGQDDEGIGPAPGLRVR